MKTNFCPSVTNLMTNPSTSSNTNSKNRWDISTINTWADRQKVLGSWTLSDFSLFSACLVFCFSQPKCFFRLPRTVVFLTECFPKRPVSSNLQLFVSVSFLVSFFFFCHFYLPLFHVLAFPVPPSIFFQCFFPGCIRHFCHKLFHHLTCFICLLY